MSIKPILFNTAMVRAILDGKKTMTRRVVKNPAMPICRKGDILYIRETWAEIKNINSSHIKYVYRATDAYPFGVKGYIVKFKWRPSIHMPKAAARIWLRVTDVRVERLRDMQCCSQNDMNMHGDGLARRIYQCAGHGKRSYLITTRVRTR